MERGLIPHAGSEENHMIVSKEQIEERINSQSNIANPELKVVHRGYGGSVKGQHQPRPEFLKEIQAGLVIDGETESEVALAFGSSQRAVSHAFTGDRLSEESKERITARRSKAQEVALDKLMDTLGLINNEKLEECSAKDLSIIAGNMSKVVDHMDNKSVMNSNVLVIYAPKQKTESEYEVVSL